ncbi:DNA repair protein [Deinococcus aquaedulcis]|uniref:DNA repair protein n=1 Tax=Deinococcus aquaedulcis TaxID=2840455 RepID=UPI001C82A110|nr:DNA repair protein [Deinococcus aquaedulcis]
MPKTKASSGALDRFQALLATVSVSADIHAITAHEGADAQLTDLLRQAHDRWGYGLHHLRHEARWTGQTVELLADGRVVADLNAEPARIATTYASMAAPDENGLSLWPVLGDGHRTSFRNAAQMRVLIEDGRDFETLWSAEKQGLSARVWRTQTYEGELLAVEYVRPTSATQLLADAAWDVITRIKDRTLQRELMKRSEQGGILQAFLSARHKEAEANLAQLAEAHFTVQGHVGRLTGSAARDIEAFRALQRATAEELLALQDRAVKQVGATLYGELR